MDDPDGYFGERVAASYDDPSDRMNQPEATESRSHVSVWEKPSVPLACH